MQPSQNPSGALAGVAQSVGLCSTTQKVVGLIPGHGTGLGCGFSPQLGAHARGNQLMFFSRIDVSLPFFVSPSLPLSLKSISISSGEEKERNRQANSKINVEMQRTKNGYNHL